MNDLMQLLNALGLRSDTVGNQVGEALAGGDASYLNNRLREDLFPRNQAMQNYLAPLEHQARVREHMAGVNEGQPWMGNMATLASAPYEMVKSHANVGQDASSFSQDLAQQAIRKVGTGTETLTSQPSIEAIIRALKGNLQGRAQGWGMR